jgi:hypothetical protein
VKKKDFLQLAVSKDKVCSEKFLSHNCFPGPQDKRNPILSRICMGFSNLVFDKEIQGIDEDGLKTLFSLSKHWINFFLTIALTSLSYEPFMKPVTASSLLCSFEMSIHLLQVMFFLFRNINI